jgi:D-xylose transport system permease protein
VRRVRAGLEAGPLAASVGKVAIVAAAIIAAVAILNEDRGVPLAAVIMIGLMAIFSFITERTRNGRHIYAVGSNAEAARRAGIRINRVRITVFTLASTLAAAGGSCWPPDSSPSTRAPAGAICCCSRSPGR